MRLIDVDKLMDSLRGNVLIDVTTEIEKTVSEQPTAFDLESVIEQLKELKTYKLNMADAMCELMNKDKLGNYVCLEDVIEILKSAANATNGKNGG